MSSKLPYRVWIGWDPDEIQAYNVAWMSLRARSSLAIATDRLALLYLQAQGLYRRPTNTNDGRLWDVISAAPMSTQHAIARFFVPMLSGYRGWALFVDGDVLFRADVTGLFAHADDRYAVQVVQHPPMVVGAPTKKDGQPQTYYGRKNWSSVMLFNCAHPAHQRLTIDELNTQVGRELHAFCWLNEDELGALPPSWNHLVGVSPWPPTEHVNLAHYTLGVPSIAGHADDPFADEWRAVAAAVGYTATRSA